MTQLIYRSADLVWVRSMGTNCAPGEYKGEVKDLDPKLSAAACKPFYFVMVEGVQSPWRPDGVWRVSYEHLRPRRDDYQQHERLGARDQLDKPIADVQERSKELGRILTDAGLVGVG